MRLALTLAHPKTALPRRSTNPAAGIYSDIFRR
jgi:hypothetical protein